MVILGELGLLAQGLWYLACQDLLEQGRGFQQIEQLVTLGVREARVPPDQRPHPGKSRIPVPAQDGEGRLTGSLVIVVVERDIAPAGLGLFVGRATTRSPTKAR